MMCLKSLYLTLADATHKPIPSAVTVAGIKNTGRRMIYGEGANLYTIIRIHSIANEIRKSTVLTITADDGRIILGKYILLIMWEAPTIEFELDCIAFEKYCHGNKAENTIIGYGTVPSVGSFATLPNITVKIIMLRNGRIMLHATPITVCL